jgi:hypothetical protein
VLVLLLVLVLALVLVLVLVSILVLPQKIWQKYPKIENWTLPHSSKLYSSRYIPLVNIGDLYQKPKFMSGYDDNDDDESTEGAKRLLKDSGV